MKILAVETATNCQSVAILDGENVLAQDIHPDCHSHASVLLPTIDRLLQSLGHSLSELDGLTVSIGPGSFTGLRVGLSTMMGIRLATKIPLVTVPTLEAMAWNVRKDHVVLCPMLKASRGEVYWALFRWESEELTRLSDDQYGDISQVVKSIKENVMMYGEGWVLHERKFKESLGAKAIPGPEEAMRTSAVSVALCSLSSFRLRQYAGGQLSPRYVQRAEAEVQWEAKAREASL